MKTKALALRFMLMIAAIASTLILAEMALRLAGFEFLLFPPKVQFGAPDPITIDKYYHADQDLFWVTQDYSERLGSAAGAPPVMVFMGCSCTQFGHYDRFFSDAVAAHFTAPAGPFLNLGVGGWSSYQGLQQLRRDVAPMRPRIVTIYYGWNDHWRAFGAEDKHVRKYAWLTRLSRRSRVMQLLNRGLIILARDPPPPQRVALPDFRANLQEMIRISRKHAIIPVLLTAPSGHVPGQEPQRIGQRWLDDLSKLVPLHEAYVQAVRDVAREENVHLVDLYSRFRDLPREQLRAGFMKDGIHLTEAGDRRIAQYLYEYFVQSGLIQELAPGLRGGAEPAADQKP